MMQSPHLPPGMDHVPILRPAPQTPAFGQPMPIPVPVVAAYAGGQTIEEAEARALGQIGAIGVNVQASPMVVFLPALCLISAPTTRQESVLGAPGIDSPVHPLWGHTLHCL